MLSGVVAFKISDNVFRLFSKLRLDENSLADVSVLCHSYEIELSVLLSFLMRY